MIDPRIEEGDHEVRGPIELVSILVRRDEAAYITASGRCACGHLDVFHGQDQADELYCEICDQVPPLCWPPACVTWPI